jgi:hypothetical protein
VSRYKIMLPLEEYSTAAGLAQNAKGCAPGPTHINGPCLLYALGI